MSPQGLADPLTLKEFSLAVAQMANNKSLGADGLPTETYGKYGDTLLPTLLKNLNDALQEGGLPVSVNKAIIVVIPKAGKDPLQSDSYRPIALLNADV